MEWLWLRSDAFGGCGNIAWRFETVLFESSPMERACGNTIWQLVVPSSSNGLGAERGHGGPKGRRHGALIVKKDGPCPNDQMSRCPDFKMSRCQVDMTLIDSTYVTPTYKHLHRVYDAQKSSTGPRSLANGLLNWM